MIERTVIGIDPGLANTGVVVHTDGRFVLAKTVTTPSAGKRPEFEAVVSRASMIADAVLALVDARWNVLAIAIESYEDFGGGHKRVEDGKPIPNRWTTPIVCALIADRLAARGYTVVWQRPSVVMSQYRAFKQRWAAKQNGIVPGDELLTNDHLRSAACHVLAWLDANRIERSTR